MNYKRARFRREKSYVTDEKLCCLCRWSLVHRVLYYSCPSPGEKLSSHTVVFPFLNVFVDSIPGKEMYSNSVEDLYCAIRWVGILHSVMLADTQI